MNILMLPDDSQNNPYQRELAAALRKHGVHVTLCKFNRLPVLRAVWACRKPDILHLHWTDGFIVAKNWPRTIAKSLRFLIELFVVKILGIRVVWTVHNLSNHEKIKPSYEIFINRFLVRLYDQMIVHCSFAREAVIQMYNMPHHLADRIQVIPHGHFIDCYKNNITREEARTILDYKEHEILFLYFGGIRPYKGVLELIDAFHTINCLQARLFIVGSPANDASKAELLCRCQTDSRIRTHLQFIPQDEIQIYMNAADVAVFPFTDILTSGSVLLAMSFGKAIVVPRIGCIPETLDTQGSFLYDLNDGDGLLRAIQNALSSDLVAMGRYNRDKAKYYDWEEIAKKTLALYCRSGAGS